MDTALSFAGLNTQTCAWLTTSGPVPAFFLEGEGRFGSGYKAVRPGTTRAPPGPD